MLSRVLHRQGANMAFTAVKLIMATATAALFAHFAVSSLAPLGKVASALVTVRTR